MSHPPQTGKLLAVTALGSLRAGLTQELIGEITQRGCIIRDSRLTPMGRCLSASFLVGGNWSALGRLETALPNLGQRLQVQMLCQRTDLPAPQPKLRPYAVDIVAPEQRDTLARVVDFFCSQSAQIAEAVSMSYAASQTAAGMCNLHLSVHIPIDQQPQSIRDAFLDLCDELNADGIMDPIKG